MDGPCVGVCFNNNSFFDSQLFNLPRIRKNGLNMKPEDSVDGAFSREGRVNSNTAMKCSISNQHAICLLWVLYFLHFFASLA